MEVLWNPPAGLYFDPIELGTLTPLNLLVARNKSLIWKKAKKKKKNSSDSVLLF